MLLKKLSKVRARDSPDKSLGARRPHAGQKVKSGDDNLRALEAMLPESEKLNDDKRICVVRRAGKAYDDLKEYDKVAHSISKGPASNVPSCITTPMQRRRVPSASWKWWIPPSLIGSKAMGMSSVKPAFVLGMPRSGRTR